MTGHEISTGALLTGLVWLVIYGLRFQSDIWLVIWCDEDGQEDVKTWGMAMECHGAASTTLPTCAITHDLRVVDNHAWFCGAFRCAITHLHVVGEPVWIWIQNLNLEQNMTVHIIAPPACMFVVICNNIMRFCISSRYCYFLRLFSQSSPSALWKRMYVRINTWMSRVKKNMTSHTLTSLSDHEMTSHNTTIWPVIKYVCRWHIYD